MARNNTDSYTVEIMYLRSFFVCFLNCCVFYSTSHQVQPDRRAGHPRGGHVSGFRIRHGVRRKNGRTEQQRPQQHRDPGTVCTLSYIHVLLADGTAVCIDSSVGWLLLSLCCFFCLSPCLVHFCFSITRLCATDIACGTYSTHLLFVFLVVRRTSQHEPIYDEHICNDLVSITPAPVLPVGIIRRLRQLRQRHACLYVRPYVCIDNMLEMCLSSILL